jgi:iron complex transport system substrate-binding protein
MIAERVLSGRSIYDLDVALLTRLAPDLILTQELCAVCAVAYDEVLAAARSLPKEPVVASFEPRTVDEIFASIERVGRLAGVAERGIAAVGQLRRRLDEIERAVSGRSIQRVVCLEWLDPPMVGGHWVPEMVRRAGGVDALGPEGMPSVPVPWEQVAEADPDVIILMPCGYDLPSTLAAAAELVSEPIWPALRAAREGRVYAVDGSGYFNRPGPRIVEGIALLAELLHPSLEVAAPPHAAACLGDANYPAPERAGTPAPAPNTP